MNIDHAYLYSFLKCNNDIFVELKIIVKSKIEGWLLVLADEAKAILYRLKKNTKVSI